jgi:hypothetical protein
MSRLIFASLLLLAALLPSGAARAEPGAFGSPNAFRLMAGSITVPPEWDGVWTSTDSTYNCLGASLGVSTVTDTLCAGQVISQDGTGLPVIFTCTGTADANSIHQNCTGSMQISADCQVEYQIQIDGTRSGTTFRSVTVSQVTYTGTGLECTLLPGSCRRVVSYATRSGPAPLDYCVTPVKGASWGRLKMLYR